MSDQEATERIVGLLAGLLLLSVIATAVLNYLESNGVAGIVLSYWTALKSFFLQNIWPIWKIVAAFVSAFAIAGILNNLWKLRGINLEERLIYYPAQAMAGVTSGGDTLSAEAKTRWEKILELLNSSHESGWRHAVIEGDIMLADTLRANGMHGDSVGEMLKSADANDYSTLDDAWEAHKIRNNIAHAGPDFKLSEREAKHAIGLFEKVFKEFGAI